MIKYFYFSKKDTNFINHLYEIRKVYNSPLITFSKIPKMSFDHKLALLLLCVLMVCQIEVYAQSGGSAPPPTEKKDYQYSGEEMDFGSSSEEEESSTTTEPVKKAKPKQTGRTSSAEGVIYEDGDIKQIDFSSGRSGGVLKFPTVPKKEAPIVDKKETKQGNDKEIEESEGGDKQTEVNTDKQVRENYTGPTFKDPKEIDYGVESSETIDAKEKTSTTNSVTKTPSNTGSPIPADAINRGAIGPSTMPTGTVSTPNKVNTGTIGTATTTTPIPPNAINRGTIGPSVIPAGTVPAAKVVKPVPPNAINTGTVGPSIMPTTATNVPARVNTGTIGPADMEEDKTNRVNTGTIGPADMEEDNLYQATEQRDVLKQHKILQGVKETGVYPFSPDEVPIYEPEVLRERVLTLPTIIPMEYNDKVEHFINLFVKDRREQVETMLSKTEMYFPVFEEALDRHGLPMELKYLPIIESALMPHARSENGAVGLWQLPYGTARMYGLESNSYIDERRDPLLATEVAVTHLENLYKTYQDWYLVIAAYNCGEGTVNKAIKRAGGETDYWKIVQFLPEEAHAYVPLYIAAVYVMHYFPEHNLRQDAAPYSLYVTDTVMVKQLLDLKEVATYVSINIDELLFLNPAIVRNVIPASKNGYPLVLPLGKIATFQIYLNNQKAKQRDIVFEDPGIPELSGDSPWNLVSEVEDTKIVTNKTDENEVDETKTVGETSRYLKTSEKEFVDKIINRPEVKKIVVESDGIKQTISIDHEVIAGQGLSDIANLYNCDIEELMKWNKLRNKRVKSGTVLSIIVPAEQEMVYRNIQMRELEEGNFVSKDTPVIVSIQHRVEQNDTYDSLEKKYQVDKKDILQLNSLKGSDAELKPGMIILIPKK